GLASVSCDDRSFAPIEKIVDARLLAAPSISALRIEINGQRSDPVCGFSLLTSLQRLRRWERRCFGAAGWRGVGGGGRGPNRQNVELGWGRLRARRRLLRYLG